MTRVAIIDAGGANLGSVRYAFERLAARPYIARDADELAGAERIVLPGVGAAAPAMARLRERGLDAAVRAAQVPVLGICLGMQLLHERSDEGDQPCLGILRGRVRRLRPATGVRVPHMGWNVLRGIARHCRLLDGIAERAACYFVHGYAIQVGIDTVAMTAHGDAFAAVVRRGRYCGTQFHPERSGAVGARVLANFLRWTP